MTNAKQALLNANNRNKGDSTEQARAIIAADKDISLESGVFSGLNQFQLAQRMANALISSNMVPANFRDVGSCLIAIDMAARLRMNVLAVMQNMYIVHGKPAWSSQFIISSINQSGLFGSSLHFEFVGEEGKDSYGCYAWVWDKQHKEKIEGTTITIKMAKAEGWYDKAGSKWKTMPEQMLRYRAAAFFGRTYAPDVTMGIYTKDEVEDSLASDGYEVVTGDEADYEVVEDEEVDEIKTPPSRIDPDTGEVVDVVEDDFFEDDFEPVTGDDN